MDWDQPKPKPVITVGEDLSALSIADLEQRVAALHAEISRIDVAIQAKRRQQEAAASIFKR